MDYRIYKLSRKEKILYSVEYLGIFLLFGKIFYDSFYIAFAGVFFLPRLLKRKAQMLAAKTREVLTLEFKDYILALSASLKAGYSAENALIAAGRDLFCMYGEESMMVAECRKMEKNLKNNQLAEVLLTEFAERSGQEEIRDFAAIFVIAKRSGGGMGAIIKNTADIISEKIEVKREIQLLYASKRMEQNIMNVVPIAMIGYVRMTTPDYFQVLYHNVFGIVIMSMCLAVYAAAYLLSCKIMDIEV